ncbi:MAG: hypothetical protein H0Z40_11355 [Desulfotomaculum sp.]|nr:hypothetical protein [Desulfotomaculum sp.]
MGRLNLKFLEELVSSDGELQVFINKYYQQKTLPLFVQLIEEGKKNGEVDPGIPIESVLFYLNVFKKGIEGYPVSYFLEEGEGLLRDLITLFFYGVKEKMKH